MILDFEIAEFEISRRPQPVMPQGTGVPRIFEAYSSLLGVRCKMLDLRYALAQKHGVYFVHVPNMSSCLARTSTSRALCRIKTSLTSLKTASATLVTSANPTVAAAGKHERGGMPEPQTREPDELARSSGSSGASGSRPGPPAASEHQRRLEKKALRASIKAALKSLSQEQKRSESARVCSTILEDLRLIDDLPTTAGVGIYLACETLNEVDAGDQGKTSSSRRRRRRRAKDMSRSPLVILLLSLAYCGMYDPAPCNCTPPRHTRVHPGRCI